MISRCPNGFVWLVYRCVEALDMLKSAYLLISMDNDRMDNERCLLVADSLADLRTHDDMVDSHLRALLCLPLLVGSHVSFMLNPVNTDWQEGP